MKTVTRKSIPGWANSVSPGLISKYFFATTEQLEKNKLYCYFKFQYS
jgi:hypothetical protein